jgi:hypothetical protein
MKENSIVRKQKCTKCKIIHMRKILVLFLMVFTSNQVFTQVKFEKEIRVKERDVPGVALRFC